MVFTPVILYGKKNEHQCPQYRRWFLESGYGWDKKEIGNGAKV